jgi:hypothetical protein
MNFEYQLIDKNGSKVLVLENLTRKTFEERMFSSEINYEYYELSEHDYGFYDKTTDEEVYGVTIEYINFINDFLNILDGEYSDEEKMIYFNNKYCPPYRNMQGCKIVKYN